MKKKSKKNISDSERRPTRKTRERLWFIKNLYDDNSKISYGEVSKIVSEKFKFTPRRAGQFIERYNKLIKENPNLDFDDRSQNQIVRVTAEIDGPTSGVRLSNPNINNITPTEKLPTTEAELKEYRYKKILSPEAQAMRLDSLINASMMEHGIAQIQALKLLDEITKDYSDTSEEPEPIFLRVVQKVDGNADC